MSLDVNVLIQNTIVPNFFRKLSENLRFFNNVRKDTSFESGKDKQTIALPFNRSDYNFEIKQYARGSGQNYNVPVHTQQADAVLGGVVGDFDHNKHDANIPASKDAIQDMHLKIRNDKFMGLQIIQNDLTTTNPQATVQYYERYTENLARQVASDLYDSMLSTAYRDVYKTFGLPSTAIGKPLEANSAMSIFGALGQHFELNYSIPRSDLTIAMEPNLYRSLLEKLETPTVSFSSQRQDSGILGNIYGFGGIYQENRSRIHEVPQIENHATTGLSFAYSTDNFTVNTNTITPGTDADVATAGGRTPAHVIRMHLNMDVTNNNATAARKYTLQHGDVIRVTTDGRDYDYTVVSRIRTTKTLKDGYQTEGDELSLAGGGSANHEYYVKPYKQANHKDGDTITILKGASITAATKYSVSLAFHSDAFLLLASRIRAGIANMTTHFGANNTATFMNARREPVGTLFNVNARNPVSSQMLANVNGGFGDHDRFITEPITGIPFRLTIWKIPNNNSWVIRFQYIYDFYTVDPRLAARIVVPYV